MARAGLRQASVRAREAFDRGRGSDASVGEVEGLTIGAEALAHGVRVDSEIGEIVLVSVAGRGILRREMSLHRRPPRRVGPLAEEPRVDPLDRSERIPTQIDLPHVDEAPRLEARPDRLRSLERELEQFGLEEWEPSLAVHYLGLSYRCARAQGDSGAAEAQKIYERLCRVDMAAALELDG